MRLYIAGPMTGLPEYNFPAFFEAEEQLKAAGYDVENPARTGLLDGWIWSDYLRSAVVQLVRSDGVALLPGYQNSPGARLESRLALDLGMTCRRLSGWLDQASDGPVLFPSSMYVRTRPVTVDYGPRRTRPACESLLDLHERTFRDGLRYGQSFYEVGQ